MGDTPLFALSNGVYLMEEISKFDFALPHPHSSNTYLLIAKLHKKNELDGLNWKFVWDITILSNGEKLNFQLPRIFEEAKVCIYSASSVCNTASMCFAQGVKTSVDFVVSPTGRNRYMAAPRLS